MKTQIVEFEMENGAKLLIESSEKNSYIDNEGIAGEPPIKRVKEKFNDMLNFIKPTTEIIINKFKEIKNSPQEIELNFGLKVNTKVNFVVGGIEGETNFNITLKWSK